MIHVKFNCIPKGIVGIYAGIDQDEKIDFLLTKLTESMEEDISVLGNMDSGSIVEFKNNEYVYC